MASTAAPRAQSWKFTRHIAEKTTFPFPVTDHAADIGAIMIPVMQDIYGGGAPVSSLDEVNKQINFLFEQDN
ncbi:hypothetical protein ACFPA8_08740 [Streptomyces ovatisporus]|uniref:Uncharacterized protein n=1 Tax=Streptomyces ovatisporus TaxID=1128682 RepID=A0ABV9A2T3_9ACTN